NLNKQLAQRTLRRGQVTRIWVYRDPEDLKAPENVALLEEQHLSGIRTRVYQWRNDPLVPNFTIWNSQTAWEATLNWDATMVRGTLYVANEEVTRLLDIWERLMLESQEWPLPSGQ